MQSKRTPQQVHEQLVARLLDTQAQLNRLYQSEGGNWRRLKRQVALADAVESLKVRIRRAEQALRGTSTVGVPQP